MGVYLDYNASAPIENDVLSMMFDVYRNTIGNPDSRTHNYGESARIIVENARKQVAELLATDSNEVYFTSGSTESNNIAIQGLLDYSKATGKNHIITTSIEHKSVLETVKHMSSIGFDVSIVSPDCSGRIDPQNILSLVNDKTLLVSVMHVNNETGIIQPVDVIGDSLKDKKVLFHIDATQSCGKLVDEIRSLHYDMLSFSAHKMGGPQGIGALIIKRRNGKRLPVKPITYGGQQENGIRPGTVPVALVAGCGEACRLAKTNYQINNANAKLIKKTLMEELKSSGLEYQLLKAMGLDDDIINSAIRISWGHQSVLEEIQSNFHSLLEIAYSMVN